MILKASFDDGSAYDMRTAELMTKFNIDTIFYLPADWIGFCQSKGFEYLEVDQAQELAKNFTIGSHTINHPLLTRIPIEEAEVEIVKSKALLENFFNIEVTSFCYPRGYATPALKDIVREHYTEARNTLIGITSKPKDPIWTSTAVHVGCQRPEYGAEDWLDFGIRIFKAAGKNDTFHLWGHSWEIQKHHQWQKLEKFLEMIT